MAIKFSFKCIHMDLILIIKKEKMAKHMQNLAKHKTLEK